ncbi:unnamed protein product [Angiostrongylus costaricensis]|uniref:ShKT domain-containing protein n=1 Tax=Angiostrongylus costaricensis TaxID=334426 RepID=A0A0R3Q048_ANGCS|nr:unnamed protein product [Angiostrongylus costaricensis]
MMNMHYKCLDKCNAPSSATCQNGGFPHPRACARCICPSGCGRSLCHRRVKNSRLNHFCLEVYTNSTGCNKTLVATSRHSEFIACPSRGLRIQWVEGQAMNSLCATTGLRHKTFCARKQHERLCYRHTQELKSKQEAISALLTTGKRQTLKKLTSLGRFYVSKCSDSALWKLSGHLWYLLATSSLRLLKAKLVLPQPFYVIESVTSYERIDFFTL